MIQVLQITHTSVHKALFFFVLSASDWLKLTFKNVFHMLLSTFMPLEYLHIQLQNSDSLLMNPAQSDGYRLFQFQIHHKTFGIEIWGSLFTLSPDEHFPCLWVAPLLPPPQSPIEPPNATPQSLGQRLSTHGVICTDLFGNFFMPFCSCCCASEILFLSNFLFCDALMHFT